MDSAKEGLHFTHGGPVCMSSSLLLLCEFRAGLLLSLASEVQPFELQPSKRSLHRTSHHDFCATLWQGRPLALSPGMAGLLTILDKVVPVEINPASF